MSLPDGFAVRLAAGVRVRDGGRTLIGGAPTRVTYLTDRAQALLTDGVLVTSDRSTAILADRLLASGVAEPVAALLPEIPLADVTCVVPVRDRAESLDRLLVGLAGSRVIVVDDASHEPGRVAAAVARHGAELIALPINLGPAGARNVGLRAASTPYVAFIDSDVVIDTATVRRLVQHFADPDLAAVAPRVRGLASDRSWLGRYERVRSSLDVGPRSGLVRAGTPIGWVPSAVLAVRAEAVGAGFDETMRVGEDVDLVWRLDDGGWRVRYDADIEARHESLTRLRPWLARKAAYGSSAVPLADRHGAKVAPAAMSAGGAVIAGAALAQRRWSLPVIGITTIVMTIRTGRALRRSEHPYRLSTELTAQGVSSTFSQLGQLLVRHWWPPVAVAALLSGRVRRAAVAAVIAHAVADRRRSGSDPGPAPHAAARALDDLAYGAGVWGAAIRSRSWRALVPRRVS